MRCCTERRCWKVTGDKNLFCGYCGSLTGAVVCSKCFSRDVVEFDVDGVKCNACGNMMTTARMFLPGKDELVHLKASYPYAVDRFTGLLCALTGASLEESTADAST